jgi:peptidoglycan/LPS O-acetylase OafA/YrhL
MSRGTAIGYDHFRAQRYMPELDGLRAISVLLVITAHMQDDLWHAIRGYYGVSAFFVISGFLITTLLLREEEREGGVQVGGFYVRRVFRLLPLYYLVLLGYVVATLVLHLGGHAEKFKAALPLYLTYQNDFVADAPYGHTWSLAVEEKFYLLWPLLAFVLLKKLKPRVALAATLAVLGATSSFLPGGWDYFDHYVAILLGCLLGLLMNDRRSFGIIRRGLGTPWVASLLGVLVVAGLFAPGPLIWDLGFVLLLPALIIGVAPVRRALASTVPRFLGTRSYAAYLIHPLCVEAVNIGIAEGQDNFAIVVLRYLMAVALTFAVSDVLFRLVERPLTNVGRRLAHRSERREVAAVPPGAVVSEMPNS